MIKKGYLRHFFILTKSLAKINFKLQSEGKFLGAFWHILNPLLAFGALFIIFSGPIGKDIKYYSLYLLLGLIIFNLFLQTTNQAARIIREQRDAIMSVNFPKESLISSTVLSHLIIHLVEIVLFIIALIFFEIPLINIIFYPLIMIGLVLFTYGTSLIISSLTTYILDLENIWHHTARLLWFVTPVFYTLSEQSLVFKFNYYFNPMYQYITIARDLLIYNNAIDKTLVILAIFYSITAFTIGSLIFNKLKYKFAEII